MYHVHPPRGAPTEILSLMQSHIGLVLCFDIDMKVGSPSGEVTSPCRSTILPINGNLRLLTALPRSLLT